MDTTSILNAASDTLTGQLTSEQLLALKMRELELSLSHYTPVDTEDIVIPVIFFLSIAAITILYFYFSYKTKKRRLDLVEKAIDKGQQIPDMSLLTAKNKKEKSVFDYVKNGIIFTSLGIAILLYGIFNTDYNEMNSSVIFIGGFFFAFGFAWLLIAIIKHSLDKKRTDKKD
ncbi:MAG: DUF6249 domain-containing protein [Bacteroidales bacterium]|jgi:hypothetical protein|nr:DUF6249 domain-containing protein [Bacteroidales bacterium]